MEATFNAGQINRDQVIHEVFTPEQMMRYAELKAKSDAFVSSASEEQELFNLKSLVTKRIKELEREPKLKEIARMASDFDAMEILKVLGYDKKVLTKYVKNMGVVAGAPEVVLSRVAIGKKADGTEDVFEYVDGKRYGGRGEGIKRFNAFKQKGFEAFKKGLTEEGVAFMSALTPRGLKKNEEKVKAMFATTAPAKK